MNKLQTIKRKNILRLFAFVIMFFLISFFSIDIVSAQSANLKRAATPAELKELEAQIKDSSCPDGIKRLYLNEDGTLRSNETFYLDGQFIVARSSTGSPIYLSCASASFFEVLIVRIFMILFSFFGLVTFVGLVRSALTIATAFDDSEKYETGIKGIQTTIAYTFGLITAYSIFIFVAVGVIGIGVNNTRREYNLFCQNRIMINLTFNTTEPC